MCVPAAIATLIANDLVCENVLCFGATFYLRLHFGVYDMDDVVDEGFLP